ncbi:MAG: glycosyltransferase family 2 protein [Saprospiraceae bacterium]|nr:glycosyltransferase family 2 protein [Saprospiraceae bacterium]
MPFFSVIIPTKNRNLLLKEAIQSVLNQLYQDFEIIVVDDHSSGQTTTCVRHAHDQRIHYVLNHGNGRSAARNTGIAVARGQYLCFLDDDDWVDDVFLSDFYQALSLRKFPEDIILRTTMIARWQDGRIKKYESYAPEKHKNALNFSAFHMCGLVTLCIPANLVGEDRLDERFSLWEDTHFVLRILAKGTLEQLPGYHYNYRMHENMGSTRDIKDGHIMASCATNIAAIDDFFIRYQALADHYLPANARPYLVAEKYLQYAIRDNLWFKSIHARELFGASFKSGVFVRLTPQYIQFMITWLKSKLG